MARPRLRPVIWRPPAAPSRARASTGPRPLPPLHVLPVLGRGPEDVLVDDEGRVVTGVADGRLLRLDLVSGGLDVVADTGGRPLGLEWLPDGALLVCDAERGLLRVDLATADVQVLVDTVEGRPMTFCNNAAVAPDGTIWWSDSSSRFGVDQWKGEVLEHSGTGRLIRRDPDGTVEVVLSRLEFANGVALAPDGSCVVVAETTAYRLTRLWLTGPRAGSHDLLADNLPGFPDNISTGTDGLVWVALASRRDPLLDRLAVLPPALRQAAWALPGKLQPKPQRTVWAAAFDLEGRVVHDLQAPAPPGFHMVTGVREHHGRLHLGSLVSPAMAFVDLAEVPA